MYPSQEWAAGVDRRLTQHRSDIDSLYEISERIESKVDRLSDRMETRFEQVDARFEQVDARFEQVDARFEQIEARFDRFELSTGAGFQAVDSRFDSLSEEMAGQRVLLERILEQLDRD